MSFEFKEGASPISSDDFWYDLFDGGYVRLEELLKESDLKEVKHAMFILNDLRNSLIDENLLEEI